MAVEEIEKTCAKGDAITLGYARTCSIMNNWQQYGHLDHSWIGLNNLAQMSVSVTPNSAYNHWLLRRTALPHLMRTAQGNPRLHQTLDNPTAKFPTHQPLFSRLGFQPHPQQQTLMTGRINP